MAENLSTVRPFDFDRDDRYVDRILLEVGWRRPSARAEQNEARAKFHQAADAYVAELNGEPECFVSTMHGDYCYRDRLVDFSGVTGVVTSRVARKQGLATRTTARALARCAERGSLIAGLGIFDQGFYDKLGFGTGGYDHYARIDPATLTVPYCRRTPVRLSSADVAEMHAARLARRRVHGSVALFPEETTLLATSHSATDFGLGFRDESTGELTHHLWVHTEKPGAGPYRVLWTSFTTIEQLVELLGLLRNMGDQVHLVWMAEPGGVQLQDFIRRPFRRYEQGRGSTYETTNMASANFQYRILDVERALTLAGEFGSLPVFTLRVADPVARYLHDHDGWRGVAGDYEIRATGTTRLAEGVREPDVTIEVGDLTRAWLGAVPLTTLRAIRPMRIPEQLASALDRSFFAGSPHTDWLY